MDEVEREARLAELEKISRHLLPRVRHGETKASEQYLSVSRERLRLLDIDFEPSETTPSLEQLHKLRRLMREAGLTQISLHDTDHESEGRSSSGTGDSSLG